ncbi:hypothetical protein OG592_42670 (plasmid) [Streptomyces avidinii]|nr:hypothetical protein OG592_42670 [Streptomyces avidinii]
MRNRERLGLLRVVGDVIVLHQMRWPDEIRPADDIPAPAATGVTDEEIDAAVELAAALASAGFELAQQRDAYRDAVEEVIAAKEAGRPPEPAAEPLTAGKVVDLMAALQQSALRGSADVITVLVAQVVAFLPLFAGPDRDIELAQFRRTRGGTPLRSSGLVSSPRSRWHSPAHSWGRGS